MYFKDEYAEARRVFRRAARVFGAAQASVLHATQVVDGVKGICPVGEAAEAARSSLQDALKEQKEANVALTLAGLEANRWRNRSRRRRHAGRELPVQGRHDNNKRARRALRRVVAS